MKSKFLYLISALYCLGLFGQSNTSTASNNQNSNTQNDSIHYVHSDLRMLQDTFLTYFDSTGAIIDTTQQKRVKKLARSLWFWEPRIGSEGFLGYGKKMLAAWQNNTVCKTHEGYTASNDTKWKPIQLSAPPTSLSHLLYPGGVGAVFSHWVNPNNTQEIFMGSSSGGLWKTTNGGTSWTNLTDGVHLPGYGVGAISVDPNNTNNILIALRVERHANNYNIGVFRTSNGGTSWSLVNTLYDANDDYGIMDIKRFPNNANKLLAISKDKVYRSTDGGQSFTQVSFSGGTSTCPSNLKRIYINPYNTNEVYVMGTSLHYSSNGGTSFTNYTSHLPKSCNLLRSVNVGIAEDASNTLVLSIVYKLSSSPLSIIKSACYTSTNHGLTWTLKGITDNSGMNGSINNFVVLDGGIAFKGGVRISKFTVTPFSAGAIGIGSESKNNFGTNYYHDDIRSLSKVKVGNSWHIFAGTDGGLYKSTDLGLTWVLINGSTDLSEILNFDTHSKTKHILTGYQDMGASAYNKENSTWETSFFRGDYCQTVGNLAHSPRFFTKDYHNLTSSNIVADRDLSFPSGVNLLAIGPLGAGNYTGKSRDYKNKTNVYVAHTNVVNYNLETLASSHITSYTALSGSSAIRPNCISIAHAESNPNVLYTGWYMAGGWGGPAYKPNLFKGVRNAAGTWTWTNISAYGTVQNPQLTGLWTAPRAICVHPENANIIMVGQDASTRLGVSNARMLYSTNGGQTWTDKSYGLPEEFGVNDVVYQKGTSGRFYAATDVGVYYYDPTFVENGHTGKWRCFNHGLPNVIVTDLEIDYCRSTLYASTYGRGLWEAPLMPSNDTELTVSTNQTWDSYREIVGDIRITNGAELTISGTLIMQSNARIKVEPGAELKVVGGHITSACENAPWYGIQAEGTSGQHQYPVMNPTYQSLIYLENATIENAKNAITTIKLDNNFNIVWGTSGALIRAYNSHFKNNRRSVAYMSYQNFSPYTGKPRGNRGYFSNCDFTTDADYNANSPYDHNIQVTAWEVRGVRFRGCDFSMPFHTSSTTGAIESKGIYALDAALEVKSLCTSSPLYPCTSFQHSTFTGYDVAIDIDNTNSLYPIEVDKTDFLNNYHAISLNGTDYSRITRCDIDNTNAYDGYTGINLYRMHGFAVEENHIKTHSGSITGIRATNLYLNTYLKSDELYKNQIASARHGIELKGLNGLFNWGGLIADCHDFGEHVTGYNDNVYDIRINPKTLTKTVWGAPDYPLENYFSKTKNNTERHIKLAASASYPNLQDYYWNVNLNPTRPSDVTSSITTHPLNIEKDRTCPSHISKFYYKTLGELHKGYKDHKSSFNTLHNNYKSIINGGVTQELLDGLLDVSNIHKDTLIQHLIDHSPYLSDEVLLRAIEYDRISDWDLTQILVWNGPLTRMVKEAASQSGRFTATNLGLILGKTGVSQRYLLDAALSQKVDSFSWALNTYYQRILTDTSLTFLDTTVSIVDSMDISALSYDNVHALDWYIATEQYTLADSFLSSDTVSFPQDTVSHLKTFKTLALDLYSKGGNWFTMNQNQKDSLITMAHDSSKTEYQLAQNVLEFLNIERFAEPTSDPDVRVRQAAPILKPEPIHVALFKVWPNPVNDALKIVWEEALNGTLKIELVNILGQVVYTDMVDGNHMMYKLDCSLYTTGTYILNIYSNKGIHQEKIEINH